NECLPLPRPPRLSSRRPTHPRGSREVQRLCRRRDPPRLRRLNLPTGPDHTLLPPGRPPPRRPSEHRALRGPGRLWRRAVRPRLSSLNPVDALGRRRDRLGHVPDETRPRRHDAPQPRPLHPGALGDRARGDGRRAGDGEPGPGREPPGTACAVGGRELQEPTDGGPGEALFADDGKILSALVQSTRDAVRESCRGFAWEARPFGSPWGGSSWGDLVVEKGRLVMWHGGKDINVPRRMAVDGGGGDPGR
ncbi:hypothetical protein CSHISOI_07402, partial [Colletotrichum shisoi]